MKKIIYLLFAMAFITPNSAHANCYSPIMTGNYYRDQELIQAFQNCRLNEQQQQMQQQQMQRQQYQYQIPQYQAPQYQAPQPYPNQNDPNQNEQTYLMQQLLQMQTGNQRRSTYGH